MSFHDFIRTARVTQTPRGDFIADAKTLLNAGVLPDCKTWADLYDAMLARNARDEAVAEGRKVWRQYRKSLTLEDTLS